MRYRTMLVAVTLMFVARLVSADSIGVVRGESSWNPFETPSAGGGTYWDNWSIDLGHEANIGYWLSATGDFAVSTRMSRTTAPSAMPNYLGDASTGFIFTRATNTQSVAVTILLELTSYRYANEFGWFDTGDPTVLNPLFFGVGEVGASATFAPSDSYGFYLRSPEGLYLSTGDGDSQTHFALFRPEGGNHYLMGVEDMWKGSDRDFNDFVVDVQAAPVPEPATIVLVGGGLAGLAAARRRRNR